MHTEKLFNYFFLILLNNRNTKNHLYVLFTKPLEKCFKNADCCIAIGVQGDIDAVHKHCTDLSAKCALGGIGNFLGYLLEIKHPSPCIVEDLILFTTH